MDTHGTTGEELRTMEAIQSLNRKTPDLKLRDLFAMFALSGIVEISNWGSDAANKAVAEVCYDIADAMMKVREGKNNKEQ